MKNCDRALESAARGRGPEAAFSGTRTANDTLNVFLLLLFFSSSKLV